jgi:hypothetical protein
MLYQNMLGFNILERAKGSQWSASIAVDGMSSYKRYLLILSHLSQNVF